MDDVQTAGQRVAKNNDLSTWLLRTYRATRGSNPRDLLLLLVVGIPLVILVVVPLALLILNSFREIGLGEIEFSLNKLTLDNYQRAYSSARTWSMLQNSLVFAIGSTIVGLFLGGTMAFIVERTNAPLRSLAYALVLSLYILPGVLESISWVLLMSPNVGLVNKLGYSMGFSGPIVNAFTLPAMWWVQGLSMSPLSFLLLGATLRRMDPSLEEAGLTSGSSPRIVMMRITGKLMLPAVAGVALLQFVRALESMEIPLFLGLPGNIVVFSTNILLTIRESFPPRYGLGFSYAVTLIAMTILGLFVYQRMVKQGERYAVVGGKGYRPRTLDLGKWKVLAVAYQVLFLLVAVGMPLGILFWTSLLPSYEVPSAEALAKVSLNNYRTVFDRSDVLLMFKNTAILAVVVSIGVMVISLLISWIMFRTQVAGRKLLDSLAFIPYAMPSVVLGVAFMVMFLSFQNPIYGTIWIMVIAYIIRMLPYGTRFTNAGLLQIHKELEEAAQTSGSGFWTVFTRVVVPLVLPSLISGGLYVFVLSVKVFAIAAILSSPDTIVVATQIWQLWTEGQLGELGALGVLMMGGIGIIALISVRLGGSFGGMEQGK